MRLILLPFLSGLLFMIGCLRRSYTSIAGNIQRPLAFILWLSSTLCALLFLMAVLFLVTAPI